MDWKCFDGDFLPRRKLKSAVGQSYLYLKEENPGDKDTSDLLLIVKYPRIYIAFLISFEFVYVYNAEITHSK